MSIESEASYITPTQSSERESSEDLLNYREKVRTDAIQSRTALYKARNEAIFHLNRQRNGLRVLRNLFLVPLVSSTLFSVLIWLEHGLPVSRYRDLNTIFNTVVLVSSSGVVATVLFETELISRSRSFREIIRDAEKILTKLDEELF